MQHDCCPLQAGGRKEEKKEERSEKGESLTERNSGSDSHRQLPSPSATHTCKQICGQKRKWRNRERSLVDATSAEEAARYHTNGSKTFSESSSKSFSSPPVPPPNQIPRVTNTTRYNDPVAYWSQTMSWPPDYGDIPSSSGQEAMPPPPPRGRISSRSSTNKRKSETTHYSDRLSGMKENGIIMGNANAMQRSSKDLCNKLLEGDRTPNSYHYNFPAERLPDVLARIESRNEDRVVRDILPWVVPSAENLYFCGEEGMEDLGEEVMADWSRCATMGSTRPKPDFTAGLLPSAFRKEEFDSLQNYSTPVTPVYFTTNICFPFLICETKSGEEGLNKAHRQNLHSASIAVRAIIELHRAAYGRNSARVQDLYGQVLAFTISHNQDMVCAYAHFAVPATNDGSDTLRFHRYQIALLSLTLNEGRDRHKSYNFVRNVYDTFAPEHLKRIREAARQLAVQRGRQAAPQARLSFDASSITLNEAGAQQPGAGVEGDTTQEQQADVNVQHRPVEATAAAVGGTPAGVTAGQNREETSRKDELIEKLSQQLEQLSQQLEKQRQDSEKQRQESKEQIERLRQDSKEQLEKQRQDSERERQESRAQMAELLKALAQK